LLPDRRVAKPDRALGLPLRQLLRQRDYALFVLAAGLLQASHAVYYGFGSLHWRSAGLSDRLIGLLWSEGVLAEILLFAFSAGMLRRIGPLNLLLLGAGGGIVRWTFTAATSDPVALVGLQLLHGLTFGAAHLGAMHYMARAVSPGLTASAQSL
jgi:PPP family 3-phenylpropionic acid transporter